MRHSLLMAVAAAAITAGLGPASASPLAAGRWVAPAAEAIPVQYWGGWGPPRVYDYDDEPPVYRRRYVEPEVEGPIPAAEAIAVARSMGYRAISRPRLAGRVWVVETVGSAGQRARVTVHAYTGAPINIRELEPGGQRFPTPPVWRDERPSFGRDGSPQGAPPMREGRLDSDGLDRPERPAPRPAPSIIARAVPVPTPRPNIDGDLTPRPDAVPPLPQARRWAEPRRPPRRLPPRPLPPRRVDPPPAAAVPGLAAAQRRADAQTTAAGRRSAARPSRPRRPCLRRLKRRARNRHRCRSNRRLLPQLPRHRQSSLPRPQRLFPRQRLTQCRRRRLPPSRSSPRQPPIPLPSRRPRPRPPLLRQRRRRSPPTARVC